MMWCLTKSNERFGVAKYNYKPKNEEGLQLWYGDTVFIQQEYLGWYHGHLMRNKNAKGIFPVSYIHLKPCVINTDGPEDTVVPLEDPVAREVRYVLQEWHSIVKRLFVERQDRLVREIKLAMEFLLVARYRLLCEPQSQEQLRDLKMEIVHKIDWGNSRLGLDVIPRHHYAAGDCEKISPIELYGIHAQNQESTDIATVHVRGSMRRGRGFKENLTNHLYMSVKDYNITDCQMYFSLYDSKTNEIFSEKFLVKINKGDGTLDKSSLSVLFTDLGHMDITRDTYILAQVYKIGSLKEIETKKAPTLAYKRPYGCGVLSIQTILGSSMIELPDQVTEKPLKDYVIRIYCCNNDHDFPQFHENLIKKNKLISGVASEVSICLKVLHGDLEQVRKEELLLFRGIVYARKLGFSDVILPGDVRNDLYLTLVRGEFEKGNKTSGRNIEVRIVLIDKRGKQLESCIYTASGAPTSNDYHSLVLYHCNTPKWNETVKLAIPFDCFSTSHIRFEYRHCSIREKTEKKLIGFSFLSLGTKLDTIVLDGIHELPVYKCDDKHKLDNSSTYLPLESSSPHTPTIHFKRNEKEFIHVQTLLCSTKLTQNSDLLGLLRWKTNPALLKEHLNKLMIMKGEEIVKYLQDIMDELFRMFSQDDEQSSLTVLIFDALIVIFKLLDSAKFRPFKPVMYTYISDHFSAPLVHSELLYCLKLKFEESVKATPDTVDKYLDCFKVMELVMKCVVQSQLLYTRASYPKKKKVPTATLR